MTYPCPRCKDYASVSDSRLTETGRRRRYICSCGHRFSTVELIGMVTDGALAVAPSTEERGHTHEVLHKLRKEVNEAFKKAMQ